MKLKFLLEDILVRLFYGPLTTRYQHVLNEKPETIQVVSFQKLATVTLALPLCGFVFCVVWSMSYNFADSTSTHCGVDNYLPSVSASIGSYSPQKFIWRLTIALHSSPRYLVSFVYYQLHSSRLLFTLNCVEISSLLGLTVVSSTENFLFHAYCFLMFISSSFLGMTVHLLQGNLWSTFKVKIFSVNTIAWILALYFYVRHNQYCETGVYSLFAAAEYTFVISNMIFHFQAYFDFANTSFATTHGKVIDNSKFAV